MRVVITFAVLIIFLVKCPLSSAEEKLTQSFCMALPELQKGRIENPELLIGTPDCKIFPNWTSLNINDVSKTDLETQNYIILKPNDPLSTDYVPDRLNIYIDDNGIIIHQICG